MNAAPLSIDSGISGKTALVTGATGGIGIEIAKALARQGCKVMMTGLGTPEECEARRRDVEAIAAAQVAFHGADLAEAGALRALFEETERRLGPVEILVNNAATRNFHTIDHMPDEAWERALAINLTAPFRLIKMALPGMRARKWGRIVNIASSWGLTGTVGRGDYVAAKHGLVGLTRAVALEAMSDNITCNSIAPGSVMTPHAERQVRERMARDGLDWDEAAREFLKTRQPSGRFVPPEKIADLIVFLCSDAASEMTGQPIAMDGGWLSI
ncbi:MAG: SDR family oxidoreductase [Hyphomicrobiaceae bacterium]